MTVGLDRRIPGWFRGRKLPPGNLRSQAVRYRFTTENAYLATELIAFWVLYIKRQKRTFSMGRTRGRIASKQKQRVAEQVKPGMTGCCFYATGNLHPEYVT